MDPPIKSGDDVEKSGMTARSRGPGNRPAADAPSTILRRVPLPRFAGMSGLRPYSALMMPSTIFLASPNSIMVLSWKNSSFSTPA